MAPLLAEMQVEGVPSPLLLSPKPVMQKPFCPIEELEVEQQVPPPPWAGPERLPAQSCTLPTLRTFIADGMYAPTAGRTTLLSNGKRCPSTPCSFYGMVWSLDCGGG